MHKALCFYFKSNHFHSKLVYRTRIFSLWAQQKKNQPNAFSSDLINSFINNMLDTDIHLSITLLNEYFSGYSAIFSGTFGFWHFSTRVPYKIDLKNHQKKNSKERTKSISYRGCVYISIYNDNYKLMQFIFFLSFFFLSFHQKLIDNFPIMKSYFRISVQWRMSLFIQTKQFILKYVFAECVCCCFGARYRKVFYT